MNTTVTNIKRFGRFLTADDVMYIWHAEESVDGMRKTTA
jgi:hypothetical protein